MRTDIREMPGWKESTVALTHHDQLPKAARDYSGASSSLAGTVDLISTGPDREHTIVLRHPFKQD